eukprot:gene11196-11345_t
MQTATAPRDAHDDGGLWGAIIDQQPIGIGCSQKRLFKLELLHYGQPKAANTVLFKSDFVRIGQFAKKLGLLQGDWQNACEGMAAASVDVEALQALTEAWRSFSAFAVECSTTGPIRALFNCLSLPQQLANCSGRLTQGLAAVGTIGLQSNPDLQEDLQQLARQLGRCCSGCVYSREQHEIVFELHEQAEAVRNGGSDAAILSAILTEKVLQACTAAQLAHDVLWLREQLQAEVAIGNQVKASLWQQLLDICQALLPSDGSSNLTVPSTASRNQQPVKAVTAESLFAILVSSKVASSAADESNADEALQAALAIRHSMGADNSSPPCGLAALVRSTLATNAVMKPRIKVAILELMTAMSQCSEVAAQQLVEDHKIGRLGAAGVMPALTTLFKTSTDEGTQRAAGHLLVKLLLHGSEVAVQAIKSNMVPALVDLYAASRPGTGASGNSGSSSAKLHSTISDALLWLLRPPAADDALLTLPLLQVLCSALSCNHQARTMAHAHAAGMAKAIQLATSKATPHASMAGRDAAAGSTASAALAAAFVVQVAEDKALQPELAPLLGQVLADGSDDQAQTAAWLVARIASPATLGQEPNRAAVKAGIEFCNALAASEVIGPMMRMLESPKLEHKTAGASAMHCMATLGGCSLHNSILLAGAVPVLVDIVVRSTPAEDQLARAAVGTLASLAANAEAPLKPAGQGNANGTTAAAAAAHSAVFDLLVTNLQPSTLPKAANAAAALQAIVGASPNLTRHAVVAGALSALVKLLQQPTSSDNLAAMQAASRLMGQLLKLCASGLSSSDTEDTGFLPAVNLVVTIANSTWSYEKGGQEQVAAAKVIPDWLDALRCTDTNTDPGCWSDAAAGLASLAALNSAACSDLARALRQLVVLGADDLQDASREDKSSLGKKAAKSGLLSVGEASNSNRSPKGGSSSSSTALVSHKLCVVDPKVEAVRAGAIAALVGLIRGQVGQNPAAPAVKGNNKAIISNATGSSSSSLVDRSAVVREAAESLYVLMGCQIGRDAAVAAGAVEVLQDVVNAGKRRDLEQKAAVAAQDALMRVL